MTDEIDGIIAGSDIRARPADQALVSDGAPADRHPSGFDPSRKVWLIWATEGEYSDRSEWPVAVALTQQDGEARTKRLGQLWRHLCQEYQRREAELDAIEDWCGDAIYQTPEGREFLDIGGSQESFGGYADDRMYTCSEVRVVLPRDSEAGETHSVSTEGESAGLREASLTLSPTPHHKEPPHD